MRRDRQVCETEEMERSDRPVRERRPPERYGLAYCHNSSLVVEPSSYADAIQSEHCSQWQKAMEEEVDALKSNGTWQLVQRPKDKNVIPGKWVFKTKLSADGTLDRYKARYVAKGFKQVEGLDFHETFAPTCKPETLRLILALAPQQELHLNQMDVKSAYLHSSIEEEVYLEQPEGFSEGRNLVCKLNKSIYGLKQAARNWYVSLANFLRDAGFTRSSNDYCLFTRRESEDKYTYILTWVDDIIIAGQRPEAIRALKEEFSTKVQDG